MLKCCLDRYKTQEICDKTVYGFQPTLRCFSDWFVTNKIIKNLLGFICILFYTPYC